MKKIVFSVLLVSVSVFIGLGIGKYIFEKVPQSGLPKKDLTKTETGKNDSNANSIRNSSLRERTFVKISWYKAKEWETPSKITISKTSDKFMVTFFKSNGEVDYLLTSKDLFFDEYLSESMGSYYYEGLSIDNYPIMKIQTYRPLEDFIINGVSSEKKLNRIRQFNIITGAGDGGSEFIVE